VQVTYKMRVFYIVAILLATLLYGSGEDADCPSTCKCEVPGTSGIIAKCNALDPMQQFGIEVTALDLSNIPESANLN
ncbi:hypothetical protein L9F63_001854, partial [Diploptera punctata]